MLSQVKFIFIAFLFKWSQDLGIKSDPYLDLSDWIQSLKN